MEPRKLTGELALAGQIDPGDIASLAAQGIRAIVCNRPDGEAADQPAYSVIEKVAAENGIKSAYLPVIPTAISDADAAAFATLLDELPKPILAYCRSGMRSTALWALSQAGKLPAEDIVGQAAKAGYDLRPLLPRLAK